MTLTLPHINDTVITRAGTSFAITAVFEYDTSQGGYDGLTLMCVLCTGYPAAGNEAKIHVRKHPTLPNTWIEDQLEKAGFKQTKATPDSNTINPVTNKFGDQIN